MLYWLLKILFTPLVHLLFRPVVVNAKSFNIKGKGIVISNHFSLADPVILCMMNRRPIRFMAKEELFENRLFGLFLRLLYVFPVAKRHADFGSVRRAKAILDKNQVFGIFPEGTRSLTNEMNEFERGAAFLALRTNATIVPVYSDPETFRRFRIRLIVGNPIDPAEAVKSRPGKPVDVLTERLQAEMNALKHRMEELV